MALAKAMEVLLAHDRAPLAIFYDNACALRSFARNPKRLHLSAVASRMAETKYLLDIWHRWNHLRAEGACLKDPDTAAAIDPYHINNKALAETYNTEACEQAFSWMDQFCPFLLEMGPGLFAAHLTMMMDRRNESISRKRQNGQSSSDSCDSGTCLPAPVLMQASKARFAQLRQREMNAERAWHVVGNACGNGRCSAGSNASAAAGQC